MLIKTNYVLGMWLRLKNPCNKMIYCTLSCLVVKSSVSQCWLPYLFTWGLPCLTCLVRSLEPTLFCLSIPFAIVNESGPELWEL